MANNQFEAAKEDDLRSFLFNHQNEDVQKDAKNEYMKVRTGSGPNIMRIREDIYMMKDCELVAHTQELNDGTIHWKSEKEDPCKIDDIRKVLQFSIAKKRSLVINVGPNESITIFPQPENSSAIFQGKHPLALHFCASHTTALRPSGVDFIDAWTLKNPSTTEEFINQVEIFKKTIEKTVQEALEQQRTVMVNDFSDAKLRISENKETVNQSLGNSIQGDQITVNERVDESRTRLQSHLNDQSRTPPLLAFPRNAQESFATDTRKPAQSSEMRNYFRGTEIDISNNDGIVNSMIGNQIGGSVKTFNRSYKR